MVDQTILRRLVLAKRLLQEAKSKSLSEYNYADQMLAVLLLFLAVETTMASVVRSEEERPDGPIGSKGYSGKPPSPEQLSNFNLGDYHKFEQLHDQVVATLRMNGALPADERLYDWGKLLRLQKARNDAQHGAMAPHPADLPEYASTAETFCERVLKVAFPGLAISFQSLSLAALLEDPVLRAFAEASEGALASRHFQLAALHTRIAFLLGRLKRRFDWWTDRHGHSVMDDHDWNRELTIDWDHTQLGTGHANEPLSRLLWGMMMQVMNLPSLYDNWILGLDQAERLRLEELTPRLVTYPPGTYGAPPSDERAVLPVLEGIASRTGDWKGPTFGKPPSQDEATWAHDFMVATLSRWERELHGKAAPVDSRLLVVIPMLQRYVTPVVAENPIPAHRSGRIGRSAANTSPVNHGSSRARP